MTVPLAAGAGAGTTSWRASYTTSYPADYPPPAGSPRAGQLNSVVAFSPTSALAAGWSTDGETDKPVITRWNGSRWSRWRHQPTFGWSPNFSVSIRSITGTSLRDVWVVVSPATSPSQTVRHFDGRRWRTVTSAGLPPAWQGTLQRIGSRFWLSGEDTADRRPFLASFHRPRHGHPRWATIRWARDGGFLGGSAHSRHDAWAVGGTATDAFGDVTWTGRPLASHWDGRAWRRTPSPHVAGYVTAVASTSAHDALAVGYQAASGPLAVHWDGRSWAVVTPPSIQGSFAAVAPAAGGGYWVAGTDGSDATHSVYYRYDGGRWSRVLGPQRSFTGQPSQYVAITAMTSVPGSADTWAVGFDTPNNCQDEDSCPNTDAGRQIIDRNH